jgi:hypothetical protein
MLVDPEIIELSGGETDHRVARSELDHCGLKCFTHAFYDGACLVALRLACAIPWAHLAKPRCHESYGFQLLFVCIGCVLFEGLQFHLFHLNDEIDDLIYPYYFLIVYY